MAPEHEQVSIANGEKQVIHNWAKFGPDIWGDLFTSFVFDDELLEIYNSNVDVLKEQVRAMLVAAAAAAVSVLAGGNTICAMVADTMNLIDKIERLGLSYHFEDEIEQIVEHMFTIHNEMLEEGYDLYTASLHFRIFRQHGYPLSADTFSKFTDENGEFIVSLSGDIMGMLNLYEAAHLGIHGEDILDQAMSFAKTQLKKSLDDKSITSDSVEEEVRHALMHPLHRSMHRLHVRRYISLYQHQHGSKNHILLELAKLDFNRLQLLYRQELCEVTRWWKDLLSVTGVSYVRNRAVESYFWCGSSFIAPKYALARAVLTKHLILLTMNDDTYDAYATYEELLPFTDAWQKWDMNAVDALPDYMKPLYTETLKMYAQMEKDLAGEAGDTSTGFYYIQEAVKQISRHHMVEAQWLNEGYTPTFDEQLANGLLTSTDAMHASMIVGIGEYATIEAFEWIAKRPKSMIASSLIARLLNDIAGHKQESKRKHIPSAIDCYMRQYNVCQEEATEELYKMIDNAWKDFNEEMLRPTAVSRQVLIPIGNFICNTHTAYLRGDGFTKPRRVEHHIRSLYVDPIPM